MLECKHLSGSSHTALDLVEDQKNAFLITECTNALHKILRSRMDTSLAL